MTGETIEVHGSGRTDKGVHAAGQVVNFYLPEPMEPQQIKAYCNEYLPEDIGVLSVEQVPCLLPQQAECREENICIPHRNE